MRRTIIGIAVALLAGPAGADEKETSWLVRGKVKKVDVNKLILVVEVQNRSGKAEDIEVKVGDDTRFIALLEMGGKKEYTGQAGLKAAPFQHGAQVQVFKSPKGNVLRIIAQPGMSRAPDMGRPTPGKIKKIDPTRGVLTLTITEKDKDRDMDIPITAETRFLVLAQESKKEYTAQQAVKVDQFKPGTTVTVLKDPKGKARLVLVGPSVIKRRPIEKSR